MGTFAIATNRKADSLAIAETGNKIYSTEISISFGKTFLAPPLVFPSVELDSGAITNYIPAVIATNISNSGCTITLNVFKLAAATKGNLGFKVNVMAVGLTQL
jgi:hypothetical protein